MTDDTRSGEQAREERAYAVGIQALLWGRPLIMYQKTASAGIKAGGVGLNYYRKFSNLKTAKDRFINTPNNVTIDAYAFVDVTHEPVVLKVPALREDRWYIVQVIDLYDETIYDVGGSKGQEPGLFLVTGPDYHGPIPAGMKEIRLRTHFGALGNRIVVNGEKDLPAAREVQAGFHALPLRVFERQGLRYEVVPGSAQGLEFTPTAAEALRQYETLGFCMRLFLSRSDDYADELIRSFRCIGLSVAAGFDSQGLDEPTKRGLARAAGAAEAIIADAYANSATIVDGWRYTMATGRAGSDLALRAAFASNLTGANVAEETLYPNCRVDGDGKPLDGNNKYLLHFDKTQLPPVSVFWNMAMYDKDQLFIENDFGRYSIGSTTDGLKTNPDGSLDIFIQSERPADTANWLPAPKGPFNLTLRLYGSQTPILDGSYHLPPVVRR